MFFQMEISTSLSDGWSVAIYSLRHGEASVIVPDPTVWRTCQKCTTWKVFIPVWVIGSRPVTTPSGVWLKIKIRIGSALPMWTGHQPSTTEEEGHFALRMQILKEHFLILSGEMKIVTFQLPQILVTLHQQLAKYHSSSGIVHKLYLYKQG